MYMVLEVVKYFINGYAGAHFTWIKINYTSLNVSTSRSLAIRQLAYYLNIVIEYCIWATVALANWNEFLKDQFDLKIAVAAIVMDVLLENPESQIPN